jgi:hypothetical protein
MKADTTDIALPVSEVLASGSGRGAGATPARGRKAKKGKKGKKVVARGRGRVAAGKKKKKIIKKKRR